MNRNTSISLGSYFLNFIHNRISAGRYNNASEVVRAGLRLLEEEENRIIALKDAIQEGIDSGIAHDFNPKTHLEQIKSKNKLNG
ncbi:MAG: type II toxin-antitoxin system ParD family antitoxin [Bacteroidetes bacterium]|jgi:antitoxin ParD1/3/4|nr:type II toxin-antitoxin system ParD family antitoxin [Bacteroidota bacterium]MBT5529134.1 type II toxin-antitoxin system ParD family antitoxin [Cytophagia bacterium]MBT3421565.1 type II toxin-antitoxin system ParD family antitoxin [Bacteroidota bacterium]MBT3800912.1 type II toxin-antitoxin system ParD family antitoxin [Bacteroidota bacterium]MBT3935343.1 type II toxin-antitoxin system ParD family antitoxin [Bacteroidota bacterium]